MLYIIYADDNNNEKRRQGRNYYNMKRAKMRKENRTDADNDDDYNKIESR